MPEPPDLARLSLADIAQAAAERRLPPVESWHPERSGDSEMRIAADGTWFHQGAIPGEDSTIGKRVVAAGRAHGMFSAVRNA